MLQLAFKKFIKITIKFLIYIKKIGSSALFLFIFQNIKEYFQV